MQGTLNEIDIRSILQLIELGQRTGELFVEAYGGQAFSAGGNVYPGARTTLREKQRLASYRTGNAASSFYLEAKSLVAGKFWFVFFVNGQIAYAADSEGSLLRLRDYLRRYRVEAALDKLEVPEILSTNAPEYGYLWALLENHVLTPGQGRSIIQSMIQETLFDLLSLHQGSFIFEMGTALAPQLTTLEIAPLVTKIMQQVQQWKQFHPHIQSLNQCPKIADAVRLRAALPENAYLTLEAFADGKTSLRQLARYLNRDFLTVARAIYPYVQQGWVQLLTLTAEDIVGGFGEVDGNDAPKVAHVVCIDDDLTIGKSVEYMLKQEGYKVTVIKNPLEALSRVFQLKPDLILCDIAMPELDGYEICAMLRHSTAFRQIPIVMLTGMDGFIDRVRARMVGSTDYLTKPFGEDELLMILEKYIGPGSPSGFSLEGELLSPIEEEIQQTDVRAG